MFAVALNFKKFKATANTLLDKWYHVLDVPYLNKVIDSSNDYEIDKNKCLPLSQKLRLFSKVYSYFRIYFFSIVIKIVKILY